MKKIHQIRLKYRLAYTKALEGEAPLTPEEEKAEQEYRAERERNQARAAERRKQQEAEINKSKPPVKEPQRKLPKPPRVKPLQTEERTPREIDEPTIDYSQKQRSPDEAFKETIRENPLDSTNRLIYADWLEEQGNTEQGRKQRVLALIGEQTKKDPDKLYNTVFNTIQNLKIPHYQAKTGDERRQYLQNALRSGYIQAAISIASGLSTEQGGNEAKRAETVRNEKLLNEILTIVFDQMGFIRDPEDPWRLYHKKDVENS